MGEKVEPGHGVSTAAMKMAGNVAKIIGSEMQHGDRGRSRPPFHYWDRGTMATIGRSAAVAWIGKLKFSGMLAWVAWLFVHLIFLLGFRNKLAVLIQWGYAYLTYKRGARIITSVPHDSVSEK